MEAVSATPLVPTQVELLPPMQELFRGGIVAADAGIVAADEVLAMAATEMVSATAAATQNPIDGFNVDMTMVPSKKNKCPHGRQKSKCKECGGSGICTHNRIRSRCKDCGGKSICQHNRQRNLCKDCGGTGICEHKRQRSRCKECKGSGLCEHGRQRSRCKECGGSSICSHGKQRTLCKECGGSAICSQEKPCMRSRCNECRAIKAILVPQMMQPHATALGLESAAQPNIMILDSQVDISVLPMSAPVVVDAAAVEQQQYQTQPGLAAPGPVAVVPMALPVADNGNVS